MTCVDKSFPMRMVWSTWGQISWWLKMFEWNGLWCSLIAICSSHSCCTFRGEYESTETSRKSSATLSTSGHWGTFPTFHRRHKLPTQPVNKPQLLPIPARTFLQMDKHSFYSGQTARYPDKHLQHHATFSTRHHPTETTLPTKTCYLAQHIEGFGVVGPSSFGSHTLSSVARCFFYGSWMRHTSP